ncbi:hypothetical protein [Xylanibacter muris]|uniref:Glycosyltransferase n=1 Tax=Xylanibacter muris TaxID=2736290 RepID=A0ABX2AIR1_9BACT|nr:hypothetical protein [Xylanibacter muris]NPD90946.1 hypothetical protein [Xylanibacter muris]
MYGNYKVVCNTAAGRRRYMQYLIPQIISSDIVDRYDIWVNTMNIRDIEFFRMLAKKYDKINLVWQPDGIIDGNNSINAFYKFCMDDDTVYIKLDDDIVWIEPNFFESIVRFRIDNPQYFLVSPLVINNQKSTYVLQCLNKLNTRRYQRADPFSKIFWKSDKFALELHEWFIGNYLKTGKYEELHCGVRPMGLTRFSINSIVWFGSQMKRFGGVVSGDDEEFLSSIKPTELGMSNCLYCDTIVAHFAFFPQRKLLDKGNILERYGEILHDIWSTRPEMKEMDDCVQECMSKVDSLDDSQCELLERPEYCKRKKESRLKRRVAFLLGRYKEKKSRFITN